MGIKRNIEYLFYAFLFDVVERLHLHNLATFRGRLSWIKLDQCTVRDEKSAYTWVIDV